MAGTARGAPKPNHGCDPGARPAILRRVTKLAGAGTWLTAYVLMSQGAFGKSRGLAGPLSKRANGIERSGPVGAMTSPDAPARRGATGSRTAWNSAWAASESKTGGGERSFVGSMLAR